jgi:hypothetical protein
MDNKSSSNTIKCRAAIPLAYGRVAIAQQVVSVWIDKTGKRKA